MTEERCEHNLVLCSKCVVITDAARRMADAVNLAIISNPPEVTRRGWMAFALQDGNTDHVVYPSKQAAVSHQHNEFYFCYLNLARCMGGTNVKDMQIFLNVHRHAYSHGGGMTDPRTLIMPQGREQRITRPLIDPTQGPHKFFRRRT